MTDGWLMRRFGVDSTIIREDEVPFFRLASCEPEREEMMAIYWMGMMQNDNI